jgi:peptidoglycan/LPS O-acetylase OafA/YrhL
MFVYLLVVLSPCFEGIMRSMSDSASVLPKANRLAFIDALRGFACLWVIAVHAHGAWITNPDVVPNYRGNIHCSRSGD